MFHECCKTRGLIIVKQLGYAIPNGSPAVPISRFRCMEAESSLFILPMNTRSLEKGKIDRSFGWRAVHVKVGLIGTGKHTIKKAHPGAGDRGRQPSAIYQFVFDDWCLIVRSVADIAEKCAQTFRRHVNRFAVEPPIFFTQTGHGRENGGGVGERLFRRGNAFADFCTRQFVHLEFFTVIPYPVPKREFMGPPKILGCNCPGADERQWIVFDSGCSVTEYHVPILTGVDWCDHDQAVGLAFADGLVSPQQYFEGPKSPGRMIMPVCNRWTGGSQVGMNVLQSFGSSYILSGFVQPA